MKDLSLHILDIVQNSLEAGAHLIHISIMEDTTRNTFVVEVTDDGKGMTKEMLEKVTDPYVTSRTTRQVGMGIPLFLHTARQAGGNLHIVSEPGKGTSLTATLVHDHIDRPALGDIAGVVSMLCGANPDRDFVYVHQMDQKQYAFDSREVKQVLDGMPVSELPVMRYLKEMIRENLRELSIIN